MQYRRVLSSGTAVLALAVSLAPAPAYAQSTLPPESVEQESAQAAQDQGEIVVTGDITQVDLPDGTRSGLRVVREILSDVRDVHFSMLTGHDVVRHKLVGRIVAAYESYEEQRERPSGADGDALGGQPGPRRQRRP